MKILIRWLLCLIMVFTLGTAIAFAHANLLTTSPRIGEIVTASPLAITLDFSEPLEPDLIDLLLDDWNGRPIALAGPQLTPGNAAQMSAKLPALLAEGTYTVHWHVVSNDGHPVHGSYSFSVGQATPAAGAAAANSPLDYAALGLVMLRYLVAGILLLGGGLYWMAWSAQQYGLPDYTAILGQGRHIGWIVLFTGLISALTVYSTTLPGNGLLSILIAGNWSLLLQAPFAGMLLLQMLLLLLLVLPNMVQGWYLLIWILLVGSLALGGHAWGSEPIWWALTARIGHLCAIALWLGALSYLILIQLGVPKSSIRSARDQFRPLFVRIAMIAAATTLFSGILMVILQTSLSVLFKQSTIWGTLLLCKILLIGIMLLLALIQTRRWRDAGRTLSPNMLRWEWIVGVLAILAGVWMSQIAYPTPVDPAKILLNAYYLPHNSMWN